VGDDASAADRLPGSLAALAAARCRGAAIVRVHDVEESVRFLRMLAAIETRSTRQAAGAAER
jgi:dihydropteroate synthase